MATSVLDIVGIKNQIQSILDTNNTTTSTLHDLSDNMTNRVDSIFTLNPEKIDITADVYPFVTVYTDAKSTIQADIARTQVNAKRSTELMLNVVGAVWNSNYSADLTNDPADDDLEYLMENIEAVLRNYPDLSGNVTWQVPTDVEYFSMPIQEDVHLRAAKLRLKCKVFY